MEFYSTVQSVLLNDVGTWVRFVISLMIFSLIFGDNVLARLAQHALVGAGAGYAVVMVWQTILRPQLLTPLRQAPAQRVDLWIILGLGILLLLAGGERILTQDAPAMRPPSLVWRSLRAVGAIPAALLLGAGIAIGAIGIVQGTLVPQVERIISRGFAWNAPIDLFLSGLLTLLVTTGALMAFSVQPGRDLYNQPRWVRAFLGAWMGIGRRAIWLSAGVIFARLSASRFSLLIARIEQFQIELEAIGVWQLLESIWSRIRL